MSPNEHIDYTYMTKFPLNPQVPVILISSFFTYSVRSRLDLKRIDPLVDRVYDSLCRKTLTGKSCIYTHIRICIIY